MRSFLIISFLTFLTGGLAQLGDDGIPGGVLPQLWSLITNGTLEHIFGCKSLPTIPEDDIAYYLCTREHNNSILLTLDNSSILNVTKSTKIIVHGFAATATDSYLLKLVYAYLTRYDCNVITIDYKNLTNVLISQAYCNIIVGADMISDFFCKLHEAGQFDFNNTHMVGASLGGQTVGLIGASVQKRCNQTVDRITALDPAGPIFQSQDISRRLDKTDAKFVDVIHSNMGIIGYYGSVGHVDFFPNCGTLQPGCINITLSSVPTIIDFVFYLLCSHGRSGLFFTESVYGTGPVFNSTSCSSCPNSDGMGKCIGPDVINPKYAIMGEDCPRNPPASKFVLKTNSNSPYARG